MKMSIEHPKLNKEAEWEIVEDICRGGEGSEAEVLVQLRNVFPGIGGVIRINEPIVVAHRKEYNALPGTAQRVFLKHMILKKLDDYFCRLRKYKFPHIPRTFGSVSTLDGGNCEAYLYEWIEGNEGFAWESTGIDSAREYVILDEWDMFANLFNTAGISVNTDICDPDNVRISKNIIHKLYRPGPTVNLCWKRIDFGASSLQINSEKLEKFLSSQADELVRVLGRKRYFLLRLAHQCLFDQSSMKEDRLAQLSVSCRDYRLSSLRHHIAGTWPLFFDPF